VIYRWSSVIKNSMRLLTLEDFRDVYIKINQRGYEFIFSKFRLSEEKRTKSSFNNISRGSSNFWIIPEVRERWNYLITGNKEVTYEEYVSEKYNHDQFVKMLSIGSGTCSHELKFARLNPNWEITCLDFSEKLLQSAEEVAKKEGLTNIKFLHKDIYKHSLPNDYYNIVLFHSSLHHFENLQDFVGKVYKSLAVNGKLIINEYVGANRLQYDKGQIKEINQCLKLIDKEYRKIFKTNLYKNRYYGSGILRMIISDPSECVESENILPTIKNYFKTIEEKGFGGNLLMPVLKDISHHFVNLDAKKKRCLEDIFNYEDYYLKQNDSDFMFGIYEKRK